MGPPYRPTLGPRPRSTMTTFPRLRRITQPGEILKQPLLPLNRLTVRPQAPTWMFRADPARSWTVRLSHGNWGRGPNLQEVQP